MEVQSFDILEFWNSSFVQGFLGNAIWFALGALVMWLRKNVRFYPLYIRILYFFSRKKYVLIWNDHNINTSEKIISKLIKQKHIKYKALNEPEDLLKYPLYPKYIHEIILIVSDVTKLSETKQCRKEIQLMLILYVRKGGTLLGTHDIIYRRCRNDALQNAFGCKLDNFQRENKPIEVVLAAGQESHPLVKGLQPSFFFDDGEVCWGNWSKDTIYLIVTKKKYIGRTKSVPILTVRHIGNNGTFIWLNSGDKGDSLSNSLNIPQDELLTIFNNSILNRI